MNVTTLIYKKKNITLQSHVTEPDVVNYVNVAALSTTATQKEETRKDKSNQCLYILLSVVSIIALALVVIIVVLSTGVLSTDCSCKTQKIQLKQELQKYIDGQVTRTTRLVCPVGWIYYNSSCYGMTTTNSKSFTNAKLSCEQQGSYLISLETKQENIFFVQHILCHRVSLLQNNGIYLGFKIV